MSKGEIDRCLLFIIVTVAYKDALMVFHPFFTPEVEVSGVVREFDREALREFAGGIYLPEEDRGNRFTTGLPAEIGLQQALHRSEPRHGNRRAVMQHDDHIRVDRREFRDQAILAGGQIHMAAVIALGL